MIDITFYNNKKKEKQETKIFLLIIDYCNNNKNSFKKI